MPEQNPLKTESIPAQTVLDRIPTIPPEPEVIQDLKPLQAIVSHFEDQRNHELGESKKDNEHKRWVEKFRAIWGLVIISIITAFIIGALAIAFYLMLMFILNPSVPKEDKQLAIGLVSAILGGAITFLLTKVIPFFEKKD